MSSSGLRNPTVAARQCWNLCLRSSYQQSDPLTTELSLPRNMQHEQVISVQRGAELRCSVSRKARQYIHSKLAAQGEGSRTANCLCNNFGTKLPSSKWNRFFFFFPSLIKAPLHIFSALKFCSLNITLKQNLGYWEEKKDKLQT